MSAADRHDCSHDCADVQPDWSGVYFGHFEQHLGAPSGRVSFRHDPLQRTIWVLIYDNVFDGCQTFTTIGGSHFFDQLGEIAELFTAADSYWDEIPKLLIEILSLVAENSLPLTRGVAIRGIRRPFPGLAAATGKNAVYIAVPIGPPDDFVHAISGKLCGHVYMLMLISDAEYEYYDEHGWEALEELFEQREVDPFDLARPSCV